MGIARTHGAEFLYIDLRKKAQKSSVGPSTHVAESTTEYREGCVVCGGSGVFCGAIRTKEKKAFQLCKASKAKSLVM